MPPVPLILPPVPSRPKDCKQTDNMAHISIVGGSASRRPGSLSFIMAPNRSRKERSCGSRIPLDRRKRKSQIVIREGILEDFLKKNRAEVIHMSIYEFDEEKYHTALRQESWEEGREFGRTEGRKEGFK